ncbi:phosphopantetheine adenylyltransferase [Massilia pseudoviolaceinigra]|uniref:phosphopantetheine adenylyltransferase n=1 Tax=Massilia pseudoviolaceinigra TaxID=3057165 RepID=UPI00279686DB|nr:phosphopantetheine adenylyltransferase [Massilia sp. CCM 9206]MDQ1921237.1 phosphopantetheine adenylyltransferase [Massilia sp. CCM 9206]
MQRLIPAMLVIAALIHLIPATGVLGESHLAQLYGVRIQDPNLLILMQHRAVMFGLLGLLLVAAALIPAWRSLAYFAGLVSVTSFVIVAWSVGNYNSSVGRVVMADIAVAACLLVALAVDYWPGLFSRA